MTYLKRLILVVIFTCSIYAVLTWLNGIYSLKDKKNARCYSLPVAMLDSLKKAAHLSEKNRHKGYWFVIQNLAAHFSDQDTLGAMTRKSDTSVASAAYIIHNIELAYTAGYFLVEQGAVSEDSFFEYVLPYRLATEPISNWRVSAYRKMSKYFKCPTDTNLFAIVSDINTQMKKGFVFDYRAFAAKYQTWDYLDSIRRGDCYTMTSLVTFPLRALGLPVTVDFTNSWANVNGGSHAWNVLVKDSNRFVPFMGCESNPEDEYSAFTFYKELKKKPGKVFRQGFSQKNKLLNKLDSAGLLNNIGLDNKFLTDVTSLYLPTSSITIPIHTEFHTKMAFINVFSNGQWVPVYASEIFNGELEFADMPLDCLYMVSCLSDNNTLKMVMDPFWVDTDGIKHIFRVDSDKRTEIVLDNTQSKLNDIMESYKAPLKGTAFDENQEQVYLDKQRSRPVNSKTYELYMWRGMWKYVSRTEAKSNTLIFKNVPSGGLYKLSGYGNIIDRPFSVLKGSIKWY